MSVFLSNIYLLKPQTSSLHQPTIISRLRLKCVYKFLKISLLLSWSGDTFSDSHCQIHHKLTKYYMCTTQLTTSVFFFLFCFDAFIFFFSEIKQCFTQNCHVMPWCQSHVSFSKTSHNYHIFLTEKKKPTSFSYLGDPSEHSCTWNYASWDMTVGGKKTKWTDMWLLFLGIKASSQLITQ